MAKTSLMDHPHVLDECMPTIPRDDDTVAATENAPCCDPVATQPIIDALSGMRLLADMASAIHHVDPKNREEVLRDILTACAILDRLDPMRNLGMAITITDDMRWIISFIEEPALGPVIIDPTTGAIGLVESRAAGDKPLN